MKTGQELQATQQQLKEITAENTLMRLLGTRQGFFDYYFQELGAMQGKRPKHRTNVECFNYCNDTYFELFGEYKYSNVQTFKNLVARMHEANKKEQ